MTRRPWDNESLFGRPASKSVARRLDAASPGPADLLSPGTVHLVGNVPTEFWGIGTLAVLLGRKAGTIRKWENEGVIPAASFQVSNDDKDPRSRRRLYTRGQLLGILKIAQDEGLIGTAKHISSTEFSKKVHEGWPFDAKGGGGAS